MDRLNNLVTGSPQVLGQHHLGHHLGNVGANQVSAQQLAILGIEDHLHEAIPSAGSRSLARCGKWELAHLHLVSGLDGLLLR